MNAPAPALAPSREAAAHRYATFALVGTCGAVTLGFLWAMLAATGGHFVPQVVDLYLVCQYARAVAEGHPFQYNAGEAPSTGATSLLHTAVLALAEAVGIRGEGLIAFTILLGAALYAGTTLLTRAIAARLASPREGLLAAALVALGGPIVWSFLYGSDIALFLFLATWLLERWMASADAGVPLWAVPAVLLAFTRPEGLPIALLLALLWALRRDGDWRPRLALRTWVPVAAGLGVLALYRVLTGSWLGTSVSDKSLFASYGVNQGLALASEYGVDLVRGLLLGFYPSQVPLGLGRGWASLFFPPFALVFMLVVVVVAPAALRRAAAFWLAMVAVLIALVTPSVFLGSQFQRYVIWAFPGLLALTAAGLGQATRHLTPDPRRETAAFRAVSVVWLGLAALSTARFATLYGEMAGEIYRRDLAAAQWIKRTLPPGTPMANVATSVEYLTGHRNMNLHGVTSPAFFGDHAAEREADSFEGLRRLGPGERPPYLITTASMQDRFPVLRDLVAGPPLFRSATFGDEIEIYRTQYDLLAGVPAPVLPASVTAVRGLVEVDRLNVCDSREEAAHGYRFSSKAGVAPLWGTVRIDRYPGADAPMADGGRAVLGWESFDVNVQPGRDLIIVLRTAAAIDGNLLQATGPRRVGVEFPEAALSLSMDGQPTGRTTYRPQPGWNEMILRVNANFVRRARPRLEVLGRYASFQYWLYQ